MNKNTASSSELELEAANPALVQEDNSPDDENSPLAEENQGIEGGDPSLVGSKKIRKKRETYQKIDDDVRVKLLEAVQLHGETLKSAAKRYNINYSSAKSILHTYRKEGRILKKSGQDKADGAASPTNENRYPDNAQQAVRKQSFNKPPKTQNNLDISKAENNISPPSMLNMSLSPTNIVDNFKTLLKLGGANFPLDENMLLKGNAANLLSVLSNKLNLPEASTTAAPLKPNLFGMNLNPSNSANFAQMLQSNPLENLKLLDNLYQNFNSSPQSGEAKPSTNIAGSSSKPEGSIETESADMGSNNQNQPRQNDEIAVPHALRFNTAQLLQNKIESKLNVDDSNLSSTIENAAIDTFKSFMDAQFLLHDALKKASYLNSLVQMQRAKTEEGAASK